MKARQSPGGLSPFMPPERRLGAARQKFPSTQDNDTRWSLASRGRKAVSVMPLDFADFAHHYEGIEMTEAEKREDFEVYACFMECLVAYWWRRDPVANSLGISVNNDTMALIDALDSGPSLPSTFNTAAHGDAAE